MYGFDDTDRPLAGQTLDVARANAGPLGLAFALVLAANLAIGATDLPGETGLAWSDVFISILQIGAEAIVLLVGCWAVVSRGAGGGFRTLLSIPADRALRIGLYTVLFTLWFWALAAILAKIASSVTGADSHLARAAIVAGLTTATLVLMYVQLGFLFPDTAVTGESGIVLAMALGIASARRVVRALAVPALCLTFPAHFIGSMLQNDGAMPALAGSVDVLLAAAQVAATLMYAIAMTRLYLDISPAGRFDSGVWR